MCRSHQVRPGPARRIVTRITAPTADYDSLKVLITWAEGLDENNDDETNALATASPRLSRDSVQTIFENDEDPAPSAKTPR
jgi:hypothetical protein